MPGASGAGHAAANNLLQKKWNQRAYELHVKKKRSMTTKLDTTKPKSFVHLSVNLKKIQSDEERMATIEYENRILLAKLTNILRSTGRLDNWNYDYENNSRSLNHKKLTEEQERIQRENQAFLKRLNETKTNYNTDDLEDQYLMNKYYKDLISQSTKGFELDVRGMDEEEALYYYAADRHERKNKALSHVPSNPTDSVAPLSLPAVSEKSAEITTMPTIDKPTRSQTFPQRKISRGRPVRLPVIGKERKKEEEKRKKEALLKIAMYDDKEEAVKLFKATKGMGKVEQIVTNTLAKRTFEQRQQTKAKFEEQFGLNLSEELSIQLDDSFEPMMLALLAMREDYDAEAIHSALKGEGPFTEVLIEILCTRNNGALSAIKNSYFEKYQIKLEDDISAEIKGQLKHLILSLAAGCRSESSFVDEAVVTKDAEQLNSTHEDERWNADSGKMAELLKSGSFNHVRAVFDKYEQLSGSQILDEMESLLIGDFRDAMVSLGKCLADCPQFLAEQLYLNLQPSGDEASVIRIIVTRSEVDLAMIRRSFKKVTGETLMDALNNRCKASFKKALTAMVVIHGAPPKSPAEQETKQKQEQKNLKQQTTEPYPKPLKRPPPNKDATLPEDNPLVRFTVVSPIKTTRTPALKRKQKEKQTAKTATSQVTFKERAEKSKEGKTSENSASSGEKEGSREE